MATVSIKTKIIHPVVVRLCMEIASVVFLLHSNVLPVWCCQHQAHLLEVFSVTAQKNFFSVVRPDSVSLSWLDLSCTLDIFMSPLSANFLFLKAVLLFFLQHSHIFIYLFVVWSVLDDGQFWSDSRLFLNTVSDAFLVLTFSITHLISAGIAHWSSWVGFCLEIAFNFDFILCFCGLESTC